MITDLHTHSTHSTDADHTMAEMCRRAVQLGLSAIAFTDHVEWLPDGRRLQPDYGAYFADLAACRAEFAPAGLTVLSGVELGNPHENRAAAEALLATYDFDVVIGSIHWLGTRNIHLTRVFADRTADEVYGTYFNAMAEMAASFPMDIVAHFDRIFQPGAQLFGPPHVERFERPVRSALAAMVEHDRLLELNSRCLAYEPGWTETIRTVLAWYHAAGGTHVSLNSDAHRTQELIRHREVGADLVAAADLELATAPQRTAAPA